MEKSSWNKRIEKETSNYSPLWERPCLNIAQMSSKRGLQKPSPYCRNIDYRMTEVRVFCASNSTLGAAHIQLQGVLAELDLLAAATAAQYGDPAGHERNNIAAVSVSLI